MAGKAGDVAKRQQGAPPGGRTRRGPGAQAGAPAPDTAVIDPPFWKKPLDSLTKTEWEALCDGCGRCCLVKLEDEDNGDIHYTNIVCRLFDGASCRCRDYANRSRLVPDCVILSRENVREIGWLPPTCAYRLRGEGKDLEWWHPLVSGSPDTVHEAGISVRGRAGPSEDEVALEDYPEHIVPWPGSAGEAGAKAGRGRRKG